MSISTRTLLFCALLSACYANGISTPQPTMSLNVVNRSSSPLSLTVQGSDECKPAGPDSSFNATVPAGASQVVRYNGSGRVGCYREFNWSLGAIASGGTDKGNLTCDDSGCTPS